MKIKLRRDWQGQDSWGAFVEEIAIDPDKSELAYRRCSGGNCDYGAYKEWEGESRALEFMLGPVAVTPELHKSLFNALSSLPDLEPLILPGSGSGFVVINYGGY